MSALVAPSVLFKTDGLTIFKKSERITHTGLKRTASATEQYYTQNRIKVNVSVDKVHLLLYTLDRTVYIRDLLP